MKGRQALLDIVDRIGCGIINADEVQVLRDAIVLLDDMANTLDVVQQVEEGRENVEFHTGAIPMIKQENLRFCVVCNGDRRCHACA